MSTEANTPWYATGWGRWSIAEKRWTDPKGWNESNEWDHAMGMWRAAQLAAPNSSTQACGRTAIESGARLVKGRGLYGVRTCGSPWSCPHCSAALARKRMGELGSIAAGAENAGLHARLVLLTLRHTRDDELGELVDTLLAGWRSLVGTGAAKARNRRAGMVAAVRGLEVTKGKHGWHPHIHAVVWFHSSAEADAAEAAWRAAWERQVGVVADGGWGWQVPRSPEASARYAGKAGAAGLEVGAGQTNATAVWGILERLANSGLPTYADWSTWQTYAETMKGRRALGWSGKSAVVGLMVEEEEEEHEEEEEIRLTQSWLSFLWLHGILGAVMAHAAAGAVESWQVLSVCVEWSEREGAIGGPLYLAWDMGIQPAELARAIEWGREVELPVR